MAQDQFTVLAMDYTAVAVTFMEVLVLQLVEGVHEFISDSKLRLYPSFVPFVCTNSPAIESHEHLGIPEVFFS